MKLTEAIQFRQLLFEDSQFKDFKAIVKEESSEISFDLQDDLKRIFLRMQNILSDDFYEFGSPIMTNPNFYINLTKKVTQHELRSYDLGDIMKAPREFPDVPRIDAYTMRLMEAMRMIMQKADDPARKEPEYEVVDNGNGYQILKLYNYAAARMICNKYNLTHCIGSSNTSWFKSYGEDKGRDTYYIITDAGRAVPVHSGGSNPYIITTHDNDDEVKNGVQSRGSDAKKKIIKDINSSVPLENVPNVISKAFPPSERKDIKSLFQNVIDSMRAIKEKSIERLYSTPNGSLHAIEENNRPGFMVHAENENSDIVLMLAINDNLDSYDVYANGESAGEMDTESVKSVIIMDMLSIPSEVDLYATAGTAERKGLSSHKIMLLKMVGMM